MNNPRPIYCKPLTTDLLAARFSWIAWHSKRFYWMASWRNLAQVLVQLGPGLSWSHSKLWSPKESCRTKPTTHATCSTQVEHGTKSGAVQRKRKKRISKLQNLESKWTWLSGEQIKELPCSLLNSSEVLHLAEYFIRVALLVLGVQSVSVGGTQTLNVFAVFPINNGL